MKRKKPYKPMKPFRSVEGVGTAAWNMLDPLAVYVLMRFYEKYDGFNRYDLSLTYKEVKDRMSSVVFTRSVWKLIGFGFIDIRRSGRLERHCSLYGLSSRFKKLNQTTLKKIEKLLFRIEQLKRQKGSVKKRMRMYELRTKVLNLNEHQQIRIEE